MKNMLLAFFAGVALALGGCSAFNPSATVSTVKAQQVVDIGTSAYTVNLRAENLYLAQPACGLPASRPPPLCASYAVGVKWKEIDGKVKAAIGRLQTAINALGPNPTEIEAAVAALQFALNELATFTNEVK